MEIAILSVSLITGIVFCIAGSLKLFIATRKLENVGVKGLQFLSPWQIKLLGFLEITGAVLVILSTIFQVPATLLQLAFIGFSILMAGATVHHLKRKEYQNVNVTVFLLLAVLFLFIFT